MDLNPHDRSAAVVGVLVVAAALAFGALLLGATNRSLSQRRAELWIEIPAADGLRRGDPLLLRGVPVGEVKRIDFGPEGGVIVRAMLLRPVPLTSTARARLVPADLFGRQSVVLEYAPGGLPLAAGDTLRGEPPVSLTGRIDGMATRLERVVGDTTVNALHSLLAEAGGAMVALEAALRSTQGAVAAQHGPLEETLANAAGLAANLRAATDSTALIELRTDARGTMQRLDRIAAQLETVGAGMQRTMARLEADQGTLGMLLGDPAFYDRAVATLESFDALLTDVRENPKRYINVSVF
jgi:phospholipid/cholesterol/gamma-HCH transport system substrate-binding protein